MNHILYSMGGNELLISAIGNLKTEFDSSNAFCMHKCVFPKNEIVWYKLERSMVNVDFT